MLALGRELLLESEPLKVYPKDNQEPFRAFSPWSGDGQQGLFGWYRRFLEVGLGKPWPTLGIWI